MGGDSQPECFRLRNEIAEVERLLRATDAFALRHGMPERLVFDLKLALDEVVTNVISYAFGDGSEHEILVTLRARPGGIEALVEDEGKPFDPLARPEPDVTRPLEERQVGGLGIFLVRRLMDRVEYRREGGRNMLCLWRGIRPGEQPAGEPA